MKCVCTDPKPLVESYESHGLKPDLKKKVYSSSYSNSSTCSDKNLKCDNGSDVVTKKSNDFSSSYLNPTKYFLGPESNDNLNKITAFCGCDQDIVNMYNRYFKDGTTLRSIWKCSVEEINSKNSKYTQGKLRTLFNENVKKATEKAAAKLSGGTPLEALQVLSAYEMCMSTNETYDRKKDIPPKSVSKDGFDPWLQYHLDKNSPSGKILNKIVRYLVMGMLFHAIFRTFFPHSGNVEDSLIYAMFMPHQFLRGDNKSKGIVFAFSVFLILIIMVSTYSFSVKPQVWIKTGVGLLISIIAFGWFYYKNNGVGVKSSLFGIIAFLITLLVYSAEESKASSEKGIDLSERQGGAFAKWYIPDFSSLKNTLLSGLAFNIYFIIASAFLVRMPILTPKNTFMAFAAVVGISLIFIFTYISIFEENVTDTLKSTFTIVYAITLGIFFLIYVVLGKLFGNKFNTGYLIPYIFATVLGILPIAIFLIIINIAITNYSPAIELLLLILYRLSGVFIAWNTNSTIGKIILTIFGKRQTDQWVVPLLPLVSNFIKLFYTITGENKPKYFDLPLDEATGVTNKNMFMS